MFFFVKISLHGNSSIIQKPPIYRVTRQVLSARVRLEGIGAAPWFEHGLRLITIITSTIYVDGKGRTVTSTSGPLRPSQSNSHRRILISTLIIVRRKPRVHAGHVTEFGRSHFSTHGKKRRWRCAPINSRGSERDAAVYNCGSRASSEPSGRGRLNVVIQGARERQRDGWKLAFQVSRSAAPTLLESTI